MINRRFSLLAAVAFLAVLSMIPASAQAKHPIEGAWIFYLTVDGAPPCQCIQIGRFHADGDGLPDRLAFGRGRDEKLGSRRRRYRG